MVPAMTAGMAVRYPSSGPSAAEAAVAAAASTPSLRDIPPNPPPPDRESPEKRSPLDPSARLKLRDQSRPASLPDFATSPDASMSMPNRRDADWTSLVNAVLKLLPAA